MACEFLSLVLLFGRLTTFSAQSTTGIVTPGTPGFLTTYAGQVTPGPILTHRPQTPSMVINQGGFTDATDFPDTVQPTPGPVTPQSSGPTSTTAATEFPIELKTPQPEPQTPSITTNQAGFTDATDSPDTVQATPGPVTPQSTNLTSTKAATEFPNELKTLQPEPHTPTITTDQVGFTDATDSPDTIQPTPGPVTPQSTTDARTTLSTSIMQPTPPTEAPTPSMATPPNPTPTSNLTEATPSPTPSMATQANPTPTSNLTEATPSPTPKTNPVTQPVISITTPRVVTKSPTRGPCHADCSHVTHTYISCGTDGKNYQNYCYFSVAVCEYKLRGVLLGKYRYGAKCPSNMVVKPLPRICERGKCKFEYLCGSDGKSYTSECSLNYVKCRYNPKLYKSYDGKCKTSTIPTKYMSCERNCGTHISNICGSNGITYKNYCSYQVAKCKFAAQKKNINIKYLHKCGNIATTISRPVPTKPVPCVVKKCGDYENLICGDNGRMYKNYCLFKNARCRYQKMGFSLSFGHSQKCKNGPMIG